MKFRSAFCIAAAIAVMGTSVPVCSSGDMMFSYTAEAVSKLPAPKDIKAEIKGSSVTVTWSEVKGADGYRLYEYDSSTKKYTAVKSVSGTKATVKVLSDGKHYFKAAALTKSGKSYRAGTLSAAVTAKTGKTVPADEQNKPLNEEKPKETAVPGTSVELARKMGKGWNLGNTMEAVANWLGDNPKATDFERAWGQPTTTKAMMTGLKSAGFDSVRVPVAWSNMISKDGKYTISEDYFDRVDEIVGYVLDSDMYCIINIHWDGGWWEDFGSPKEKVRDEAMKRYKAMWTQIAEHYKDYSDGLIFESANEELGDSTKGNDSVDANYRKVNNINQTFVDVVRGTGGRNKSRFLLIAGYNTGIDPTCDSRFKMPTDSQKNKLLVSVHYYSPSTYCIADNPSNSWGYRDSWGTDSDIRDMKNEFAKMKKFTDSGYGVVIGEYGVSKTKSNGKYTVKKGTDKFFASVVSLSEQYGYCPMIWDCNDWYNRNTCAFNSQDIADIYKR